MKTTIGLGMLGAGFIGQMHSLAFQNAALSMWRPKVDVALTVLAEQNTKAADEVAERYGWKAAVSRWQDVVANAEVGLFINAGPNHLHAEPSVAAAREGKPIFCEKPLASSADEAYALWKAVEATGVVHMCAFMHRSIPALNLARSMIQSGELGEIRHFRSRFLLSMLGEGPLSWRFQPLPGRPRCHGRPWLPPRRPSTLPCRRGDRRRCDEEDLEQGRSGPGARRQRRLVHLRGRIGEWGKRIVRSLAGCRSAQPGRLHRGGRNEGIPFLSHGATERTDHLRAQEGAAHPDGDPDRSSLQRFLASWRHPGASTRSGGTNVLPTRPGTCWRRSSTASP